MTYPCRPTIEQLRHSVLSLADAVRESGAGDAVFQRYLRFFATFHSLSVGNRLLVMQQRPTATWTKGFKAWKQAGRSVKRGERAIWIYAPVGGRRITGVDPETGEEKTREWTAYKTVPVWDVSQTVGGEWDPPNYTTNLGPQVAPVNDALIAYSQNLGLTVSSRPIYGSVNGFYAPDDRHIVINDSLPVGIAVRTLTHEIVHSLLWQQHEAEDLPRAVQETETEAAAAVVWMRLGYPQVAVNSGAYIASWAGDNSAPLILRSMNRIVQTASTVLDGIHSNMPEMEIRYV